MARWQRAWDREEAGREVHEFFPAVPKDNLVSHMDRKLESAMIRAITGHNRLNHHMHKIGLQESPCCDCGNQRQTVRHILLECGDLTHHREHMIEKIELIYVKHQTPYWERTLDLQTLLSPDHSNASTRHDIIRVVAGFLGASKYKL